MASELGSPFSVAFAAYKQAMAELAALDASLPRDDEGDKLSDTIEKLYAAQWRLIQTPAVGLLEIGQRAIVVQEMYSQAALDGGIPTDNRHRLMLDCLVAEILGPNAKESPTVEVA